MPLPEMTLPIANVCMGKLFNILKQNLYDNNIIEISHKYYRNML